MMDLHCCEITENETKACIDETLLRDQVLRNMLDAEDRNESMYTSRINIQKEIKTNMIAIVGEWMMEVCEEQKCPDDVFLLAMNYLYRFLSTTCIKKNQLQLVGAACMLLASKLRQPTPLFVQTLVFYTDHSITRDMLTKCELLVLSKLKWDIVALVPVDFLPHLLIKLPVESLDIDTEMVKKHAKILITLCAKECRFNAYSPSLIACASIVSALCGLGWANKYQRSLDELLDTLGDIVNVEADIIKELVSQIDDMVRENSRDMKDDKDMCEQVTRREELTPPPGKFYEPKTANTPTDVHDVHF